MALLETKNLTVERKTGMLPSVPFSLIKESLLGKSYNLSIAFISPRESQKLNRDYRKKDYAANILSFPLSKSEGEIYICLSIVRAGAKEFEMSYEKFLHLILIHGCLHLKGHDHGSTMEELENKYLKRFYRG